MYNMAAHRLRWHACPPVVTSRVTHKCHFALVSRNPLFVQFRNGRCFSGFYFLPRRCDALLQVVNNLSAFGGRSAGWSTASAGWSVWVSSDGCTELACSRGFPSSELTVDGSVPGSAAAHLGPTRSVRTDWDKAVCCQSVCQGSTDTGRSV